MVLTHLSKQGCKIYYVAAILQYFYLALKRTSSQIIEYFYNVTVSAILCFNHRRHYSKNMDVIGMYLLSLDFSDDRKIILILSGGFKNKHDSKN